MTLNWSGRTWEIWDKPDPMSGKYYYSPNVVYVDSNGWLYLNLEKINGTWYASCVYDTNPTGYGTYQWVIQGLHTIDPNCTLGLFVYAWQDSYQELDIEQGQWGVANNKSGNWDMLVQPSKQYGGDPGEFTLSMPNSDDILCTIEWTTSGQWFSMVDMGTGKTLHAEHDQFPVSATSPDVVSAYMNLYPFPGQNWNNPVFPTTGNQYYVIKSFHFYPPGTTVPTPTPTPPAPTPTGTTKINLVAPTSGSLGSSVTVYGVLSNGGVAVPKGQIALATSGGISCPTPPLTDSNGYFAVTAKLTGSGTAQVQAHYAGNAGGSACYSNIETISVSGATPTNLTLDVPSSASSGHSITAYGVLSTSSGVVTNAQVTVSVSNGKTLYPALTDGNGYFAVSYTMPTSGALSFQAHFAGESGLAASTSVVRTVN